MKGLISPRKVFVRQLNSPAEFGQSEADIVTFRDDMLLELLKMHHKI
jgi:hypothetical protein